MKLEIYNSVHTSESVPSRANVWREEDRHISKGGRERERKREEVGGRKDRFNFLCLSHRSHLLVAQRSPANKTQPWIMNYTRMKYIFLFSFQYLCESKKKKKEKKEKRVKTPLQTARENKLLASTVWQVVAWSPESSSMLDLLTSHLTHFSDIIAYRGNGTVSALAHHPTFFFFFF